MTNFKFALRANLKPKNKSKMILTESLPTLKVLSTVYGGES